MTKRLAGGVLALAMGCVACNADTPSTPTAGHAGASSTGTAGSNTQTQTSTAGKSGGTAGVGTSTAGNSTTAGVGSAGMTGSAGSTLTAGAAGHAAGGAGGSLGTAGAAGSASAGSSITGTLGKLGEVKPILNAWATTNGPETLIYLTTATLTCADMMTMGVKWLSKLPAGSQVIEIIVPGMASTKSYSVGSPDRGEVNYAEGSKSSSSEVTGMTGTIVFSKVMAKMLYEGTITVTAPFMAMGSFHAEWCQGGAEF